MIKTEAYTTRTVTWITCEKCGQTAKLVGKNQDGSLAAVLGDRSFYFTELGDCHRCNSCCPIYPKAELEVIK